MKPKYGNIFPKLSETLLLQNRTTKQFNPKKLSQVLDHSVEGKWEKVAQFLRSSGVANKDEVKNLWIDDIWATRRNTG